MTLCTRLSRDWRQLIFQTSLGLILSIAVCQSLYPAVNAGYAFGRSILIDGSDLPQVLSRGVFSAVFHSALVVIPAFLSLWRLKSTAFVVPIWAIWAIIASTVTLLAFCSFLLAISGGAPEGNYSQKDLIGYYTGRWYSFCAEVFTLIIYFVLLFRNKNIWLLRNIRPSHAFVLCVPVFVGTAAVFIVAMALGR